MDYPEHRVPVNVNLYEITIFTSPLSKRYLYDLSRVDSVPPHFRITDVLYTYSESAVGIGIIYEALSEWEDN